MLELLLEFVLDLVCLHYLDGLSDGWRVFLKILIYALFVVGLVTLVYYVFIRP